MRPVRSRRYKNARFLSLTVTAAAAAVLAAGCSSSGSSSATGSSTGSGSKSPLVIGASLSLTGDFSADGQAYQKGYEF